MLSPYLITQIFHTDVVHANSKNCDMCAIGSVLESVFPKSLSLIQRIRKYFCKPIIVWGSGFVKPERERKYISIRKLDVRAVRGHLTLKRLQKYLDINHNVALGDPGLLSSKLINTRNIKKKYDLGIIPHYVDKNNEYLKNIRVKNSITIDVQQPIDVVLKQIAQCKCIISSAMHGLIVADSFGIPNIRMILSNKIIGGDYKYDDYYSVFNIKKHPRIVIDKNTKITNTKFIVDQYAIPRKRVNEICNQLTKVFYESEYRE